ncbi:MAG: VTT domain-containing protein [Planctomycetaceae bacterium]|nr:VTT domain-containing protein [Planctomycetaceae bacterium]
MRTTFCFLGFVLFGLVLFFILGDALVERSWLDSFGPWVWLVAVGLIIADIFAPIPTTLIITLMGQRYGPILGGLIGSVGSFSAGVIAYGLTRMLGPRFARWLLGKELESAEQFFSQKGAFAVACSRWLPLLPEAISCMAGLARMPFRRYCVALLSGSVPMCFAYSALATTSDNELIPLTISIILPVPIWCIAGRLLRRTTSNSPDT